MELMEFELGNPQEDTPPKRIQRKRHKKKLKWLAIISLLVLVGVVFAVLSDSAAFDGLRRNMIYARAEKDDTGCARLYQYAEEQNRCFASVGGSLITASLGQLQVLGEDGTVRYTTGLKFHEAAVSAAGNRAAVYDIGGTEIYILDAQGLVHSIICEGAIFTANLNEKGYLAVTANKSGYKAAVYVYAPDGEMVFEFDSSERFVMTASVSDNGRQMAAVTMGQSDGTFVSNVVIYKLSSDTPRASCDLSGDAVYQLGMLKGKYCALAEDALYLISDDGSLTSYDYSEEFLRRCSFSDGGYAALLLDTYKSGTQGRLVTVDGNGKEIASLETDSDVLSLSAAGRYIALLSSDHLTIYNKNLKEVATLTDVSTAKQALMRRDGSTVLVGNDAASLYLP